MKPYWTNTHLFIKGAARFNDLIYISSQQKNLAEQDIRHAIFIAWDREKWFQEEHKNWNCAGMCIANTPEEKLIAISDEGEVWTYVGGKTTEENIIPQPNMIRDVTTISGIPYACGMNRQVYKREAENYWVSIHAPSPKPGKTKGFEAITGFSGHQIYAVGWEGEIWFYDGINWEQLDSPTNSILTSATCGEDGNIYIAGQNGCIIKGNRDKLELLRNDDFIVDIWDIVYFQGKIFLAGIQSLFFLDEKNNVQPVDFGEDYPQTCNCLTQAEDVLWSIGSTDLFSFDGSIWKRIE